MAVSKFLFGSIGRKSHSDVGVQRGAENTIWGKVVVSPEFGLW